MNKVTKNTVWNLIGSFTYYFSQWLVTILVVRLSGSYEEAGVYGLANSIGNIFVMISMFSVRAYQAADIDDRFSNGQYVTFRFITCSVSLLALPVYLMIMGYSPYIFGSVMCFMLIKTAEALVDVFQGIFQKAWRLDISCKCYVARGIANLAVFSAAEYLFKNLVVSLLLTGAASLACALIFEMRPCFSMYEIKADFKDKALKRLCLCCLPLFINGILSTLIFNIPRLAAERMFGEEMFGYYSSAATPAIVVQLAANSIFSPCIPLLSEQFKNGDRKIFRTILRIHLIIFGVGACAVAGFAWLGDWFLETVFGEEILAHSNLLIPAVIVSVLTAMSWFVSGIFAVINKNITMTVLEGIVTVCTLIASPIMLKRFELQGINWVLIGAYVLFIFIGYVITLINISKHCRGN